MSLRQIWVFRALRITYKKNHIISKEMILKHLYNGNIHMVTASRIVDLISGETTNIELVFMDDGKYSWSSAIPYYVDKYNLKLPQEFEKHVLMN